MTKAEKYGILKSFRNFSTIKIIKDLYPGVKDKEIKEVIYEAGYADEDGKPYGPRIKALRLELGCTAKEIGRLVEVGSSAVCKIENNTSRSPLARVLYEKLMDIKENHGGILPEPETPEADEPVQEKPQEKGLIITMEPEIISEIDESDDLSPKSDISTCESEVESREVEIKPRKVRKPNKPDKPSPGVPKAVIDLTRERIAELERKKDSLVNLLSAMDAEIAELSEYLSQNAS